MARQVAHTAMRELVLVGGRLWRLFLYGYLPLTAVLVLLHFPSSTDADFAHARTAEELKSARRFYEAAYQPGQAGRGRDYEETATRAADAYNIEGAIREFVAAYGLADKKILEVGSGRGYLQDAVVD